MTLNDIARNVYDCPVAKLDARAFEWVGFRAAAVMGVEPARKAVAEANESRHRAGKGWVHFDEHSPLGSIGGAGLEAVRSVVAGQIGEGCLAMVEPDGFRWNDGERAPTTDLCDVMLDVALLGNGRVVFTNRRGEWVGEASYSLACGNGAIVWSHFRQHGVAVS